MGTWKTFDVRDPAAVRPVTDAALSGDAAFFDSSPMYGRAEHVLAETLGPRRAQAQIATKVWASSGREGREQIRQALAWYGGKIDLYQIHNLVAWREHLPYLEELQAKGSVGAIGITHYSSSAFSELATVLETGRVTAIQIPLNPQDREVERHLLPLAAARNIGVVVMRPLGQGFLARRAPAPRELGFLADFGLRTWPQALLNWGISDARVSVSIPATSSAAHMADNCAVGNARRFDAAARERVAALAARL
jgi:aryl-alcohol dehydrogenase-like predicted oxidoreductase